MAGGPPAIALREKIRRIGKNSGTFLIADVCTENVGRPEVTPSASIVRAKIRQIEQQISAIESRSGGVNGTADAALRFLTDKRTELSFQLFMQLRQGTQEMAQRQSAPVEIKTALAS